MKNAGKARSYGLYRHLRTSKEIIENLLNYFIKKINNTWTNPFLFRHIYDRIYTIRQIVAIYMILYIISQRLRTDGRIYFRYGWESGIMKRADSLLYMGKGGYRCWIGALD